jgi:hypothetical protein
MQRQGPPSAGTRGCAIPDFLLPTGAHGPAQGDMGAREAPPIRLIRQHLQAVQDAGSASMPFGRGRIVVLHRGMILIGNDLTVP